MKVILKDDIKSIGKAWEVVDVKDGFARNYLIPNNLAIVATSENLKRIENEKKKKDEQSAREKKDAELLADKIANLSCTVQANAGEEDKLFGSITGEDIANVLLNEGIKVDKKHIIFDEPVKKLGVHQVKVRLHPEVTANLKFWVVKS